VPDAKKVELRGRDRRGRPIVWCDSADGPYSLRPRRSEPGG
jgi:hypothetical protein